MITGILMVEVVTESLCNNRIPFQFAVRGVMTKPTAAPTFSLIVPTCPVGIICAIPFGTRGELALISALA